ncbi:MAG: 4Fe-4S dicluster domain-containing protein [Deltaproteobacteria bacterium]|nr:4Fe-4S dicluster domain-containing protein [Deltaproteobacteria bacterium]MBW1914080.1 4Fe-4S dicluster domain-containing protein [Deltaproteobacteria bacterium]
MIKKPFFSLGSPKLGYQVIAASEKDSVQKIPLPSEVTLLFELHQIPNEALKIRPGDEVKTGQKLKLTDEEDESLISTATGKIQEICDFTGYLNRPCTSIIIKTTEDIIDDGFSKANETVSAESTLEFLSSLPGDSSFSSIINPDSPLYTIVINGIDKDLMVTANQHIVGTETEDLKKGIDCLRRITNPNNVVIAVPPNLVSKAEGLGAEVQVIQPIYPNGLPEMIMQNVMEKTVPEGENCEDLGVGFVNAETVAALGSAYNKGQIPVNKTLTVIKSDGSSINIKARIGTPVKAVLDALDITTASGDRLVFGGPMTGTAIYSEDMPILPDTDAIMVQDSSQIVRCADTPCVNCGECVRACPANVPVNMLIRLLENGLYEEAVDQYDLLSCIECGLCAYVCSARIPVFHYIMLGKYEFDRIKSAEESNV